MTRFMVLRLDGPLMSFGDVAVDEIRPTRLLPGASMLAGLLANALGWRFFQVDRLQSLQDRLIFGARLDRPGELLIDYQNAHLSKNDLLWRSQGYPPAGRGGGAQSYSGPAQRWRHYRMDGAVTVVLTLAEDDYPTLADVAEALKRPARPLFLGRVSCPPAGPIFNDEWTEAGSVVEALSQVALHPRSNPPDEPCLAEWPAGPGEAAGLAQGRSLLARTDIRDWRNDLHAGSRMIVQGRIIPPDGQNRPEEVKL